MGRKPEQFIGVPQPLLASQGGLPGTPGLPAPSPGLTHSLGPPALSLGSVLTHLPPCFCTWAKHCAHRLPEWPPRAGLLGKLAPQEENLLDGKREELGQRIPHPSPCRDCANVCLLLRLFRELAHAWAVSLSLCHDNNQVTCHYTSLFASGLCFPTSFCPSLHFPNTRSAFSVCLRLCSLEDQLGKGESCSHCAFETVLTGLALGSSGLVAAGRDWGTRHEG